MIDGQDSPGINSRINNRLPDLTIRTNNRPGDMAQVRLVKRLLTIDPPQASQWRIQIPAHTDARRLPLHPAHGEKLQDITLMDNAARNTSYTQT
jgi:hypothetical protein